jgi:ribosomal-protein-alanine N-acetyltransferase
MSRMTLTVETASLRQLNRLYEIERECFGEEAFSRQQIATLIRDYNSISLVAVENNTIIGFILGAIHFQRNALDGHVLTIDVSTRNRRRGVGSRLLKEMEGIFSEKNVKTCHLEVKENNIEALKLYEKAGYKKIGKLKNYYGRTDGLYLCKSLT